jgi:hypothetical protein
MPYSIMAELTAPKSRYFRPPSDAFRFAESAVSRYELMETSSMLR